MRIAHITRQFSPAVGGLENVVHNLANAQASTGHQVRVITLNRTFSNPTALLPEHDNIDGMRSCGFRSGDLAAIRSHPRCCATSKAPTSCMFTPQVIHAHKLSFEGIIAWLLARRLGVPFVASLRGEAETKIVRWKPTYRPLIRRVARDARIIFAVSMWFVPELRRVAPFIDSKIRPLPNLVGIPDMPARSRTPQAARFVSILDLNVYRKKGFHWLIPAFAVAARKHPDATLDVFGWSNERVDAELRQLVAAAGCGSRVRFRGLRPHAQILDELPQYAALLLPSVNETFGMVYLEALFAGIPVLYTRGTGIDGHLEGLSVGISVAEGSVDAIAAAIDDFCRNGARWRDAVRRCVPRFRRLRCDQRRNVINRAASARPGHAGRRHGI